MIGGRNQNPDNKARQSGFDPLGTDNTIDSKYGRNFEIRNLRRMMQFTEQFSDFEIVSALPTQLSWTHIIDVLPMKTQEAKIYDKVYKN